MPDVEEISAESVQKLTKQRFRKKMCAHIAKIEVSSTQQKLHFVIPNFKGADEAVQRVAQLEEFKEAKIIKINPDKPQESLRLLALEANKEILVPIPRLKSGLFFHVKPDANVNKEELKNFTSRRGLQEHGKLLGLDSDIKVDLFVLGAICVSREGYRIGKGEGFSDLEFAIMKQLGVVDDKTTIITMVHDCQVVDDLPASLFEKYDVPVDIIVTPTQTIRVKERLNRPAGIFWEILTPRRVRSMQILQQLQQKEQQEGKEIKLKEESVTEKTPLHPRRWSKKRPKVKRDTTDSDGTPVVDGDVKEPKDQNVLKKRQPRKRRLRERKDDSESQIENNANENLKEKPQQRRKYVKSRARANIDFSLKLSNIKSDVRVRHLKNALLERGVKASDISWHGYRGYCYLHFGKLRNKDSEPDQPVQVDSIVANLQHLKLGESTDMGKNTDNDNEYIVVEPAKPITRIEITDVTAV